MKPKNISLALYLHTTERLDMMKIPCGTNLTRWINAAICEKMDRDHPETVCASTMEEPPVFLSAPAPAFDPMAERRRLLRLQRGRDYVGPYGLKYKGRTEYLHAEYQHKKLRNDSQGIEALLEDFFIASKAELSTEEQGAILAAHAVKEKQMAEEAEKQRQEQEKEVEVLRHPQASVNEALASMNNQAQLLAKFEASQLAKHGKAAIDAASASPMEEPPLINVAAPTMEDDAAFWGETDDGYHKIKAKASRR